MMFRELGFGVYVDYEDRMSQKVDTTIKSMNKLVNASQTMEKEVNKSLMNMQNVIIAGYSFNTIGDSLERAGNSILRKVKAFGNSIIETGKNFETYRKSMAVFFKDSEEKIRWGIDFASKTPFEINQTLDALKTLKASGIDATTSFKNLNGEMKPFLQYVGDLAALKPELGMENVFIAIRNLIGGNKRSFEQRLDIKPKLILGREIDTSSTEALMKDIVTIASKVSPNLMASLEGTFEQRLSNIKDLITLLKLEIADSGAFDGVKDTLKYIYDVLYKVDLKKLGSSIGEAFKTLWKPIDVIVRGVANIVYGISKFTESHPALGKLISAVVVGTGTLLTMSGILLKTVGTYLMFTSSIISAVSSLAMLKAQGVSIGATFGAISSGLFKYANFIGLTAFAMYYAWRTNIGGIRDFTDRVFSNVNTIVKTSNEMIEGTYKSFGAESGLGKIYNNVFTPIEKIAAKLAYVRILISSTLTALFGGKDGEYVLFNPKQVDAIKRAGLYEYVVNLVMLRERVETFFEGFKKGLDKVVEVGKNAVNFVLTPMRAFFNAITFGGFDKLYGLFKSDVPSPEKDINKAAQERLNLYKEQLATLEKLGRVAGFVTTSLLGLKAVDFVLGKLHKTTKDVTNDLGGGGNSPKKGGFLSSLADSFFYLSREATRVAPTGDTVFEKYKRVKLKDIDFGNPDSHIRDYLLNNANVNPAHLVVKKKPEILRRLFGDTIYEVMAKYEEDQFKDLFNLPKESIKKSINDPDDFGKYVVDLKKHAVQLVPVAHWGGLFNRQKMADTVKYATQLENKAGRVFTPGNTAADRINAPYLDKEVGVASSEFFDFIKSNKFRSKVFNISQDDLASVDKSKEDKTYGNATLKDAFKKMFNKKGLELGQGKKPFYNVLGGSNTGFAYNFDPTKMFVDEDLIRKEQEATKLNFIKNIGKDAILDMFKQDYFLKQIGLDEKEIKKLRNLSVKGKYDVLKDENMKMRLGEWLWSMSLGYSEEALNNLKKDGKHLNPQVQRYLNLENQLKEGKVIYEESRKINPNASRWSKFKNTMGKVSDLLFGNKLYYLDEEIDPITEGTTGRYTKRYVGRRAGLLRPQEENIQWGEYKTIGQRIGDFRQNIRVKAHDVKNFIKDSYLTPFKQGLKEHFGEPLKTVFKNMADDFISPFKTLLNISLKKISAITPNYLKGVANNFKQLPKFLEQAGFKKPNLFKWTPSDSKGLSSYLSKVESGFKGFAKGMSKIGGFIGKGLMTGIKGTFRVTGALMRTLLPVATIGIGLGQMLWRAGGGSIEGVRKKTEQWLNFMKKDGGKKFNEMWKSFKENGSVIFNNIKEIGKLTWKYLKSDGIKILKEAIGGIKGMLLGFGDWFQNGGWRVLLKLLGKIMEFGWKALKFIVFELMPKIVSGIFKALQELATSVLSRIPLIGKLFGGGKAEVSDSSGNKQSFSFGFKAHHGGLFLSPSEHVAVIRKDETVLPPHISRGFENIIHYASEGKLQHLQRTKEIPSVKKIAPQINEGDIKIDKIEITVKADNLGNDVNRVSRQLANEVLRELKKIKKEKSLRGGRASIDAIIDSM